MHIRCAQEHTLRVVKLLLRWKWHRLPSVHFVRQQVQRVQFPNRLEPTVNHSQFRNDTVFNASNLGVNFAAGLCLEHPDLLRNEPHLFFNHGWLFRTISSRAFSASSCARARRLLHKPTTITPATATMRRIHCVLLVSSQGKMPCKNLSS